MRWNAILPGRVTGLLATLAVACITGLAGSAVAQTGAPSAPQADCPAPPDHIAAIDHLLEDVRIARDETEARLLTNEMWALWADAPNEQAQEVLDRGMRKRQSHDLRGAIEDFDILVAWCPDYAEGWNQRAFARFIAGEYLDALDDLDRAIELSPNHIPAMAGRALTLMALGDQAAGQAALRAALKLHPWLPERRMLVEQGTDL